MFNRLTNILRSPEATEAAAAAPAQSTPSTSAPAASPEPSRAAASDAGASSKPAESTPAKQPLSERELRNKERKEHVMKVLKEREQEAQGKAKPVETAAQPAANPEASKPATESREQKPDPAQPAATESDASKPERWEKSHVIKAGDIDKDGNPVDVTITFRQAMDALAKARFPMDYVEGLSDKRVFEIGSQQYLLQRDNNRRWNEMQGRRQGEPAKAETPAAATTADATKAPPQQPAAQPAASSNATVPPEKLPWSDKLNRLKEIAGDDVAQSIDEILVDVAKSLRSTAPDTTAIQAESAALKQQFEQQQAATIGLLMQERFDRAFSDSVKDFPQVEGDGSETIRDDIQKTWDAIARSGRFNDPLNPASFRQIFREAVHARLGSQLKETHARQLLQSQKQQASGQVAAEPSRADSPPAALSRNDAIKKAMAAVMRTGNLQKGKQVMAEFANSSSG